MRKIIVYNNKGGVGKTTLAYHLYQYLMFIVGERWCYLDLDEQRNSMMWLHGHRWDGTDTVTIYEETDAGDRPIGLLTTNIAVARDFDYVLVDAPPRAGFLLEFHNDFPLDEEDLIIIPIAGRFSIDGAITTIEQVTKLGARVVLVINMTDPKYEFAQYEIDAVTELGVELYHQAIPYARVIREAEVSGIPAWEIEYGNLTHGVKILRGFCAWVQQGAPDDESTYGFTELQQRQLDRYRI